MTKKSMKKNIPKNQDLSISAIYLSMFFKVLDSKGINFQEICNEIGFDIHSLKNPDKRIPIEKFNPVWDEVIKKSADSDFGLHIGEHIFEFSGHILFTIMYHSPFLKDALENFCRYYNLLSNLVIPVLNTKGDTAILASNNITRKLTNSRHAIEAYICRYYCTFDRLIDGKLELNEVHFAHPAPKDINTHKRIFNSPILFDQSENRIIFHKKYLDVPISVSNPELLRILKDHAKTLQKKIYDSDTSASKVKNAIIKLLPLGKTDIDTVANNLAMTKRNLQYKLKSEGTSFQELLDKMKKNQAKYFLGQPDLSIVDVAFLVGYSEQSTFNRAFKKWTGITPGEYRQNTSLRAYPKN